MSRPKLIFSQKPSFIDQVYDLSSVHIPSLQAVQKFQLTMSILYTTCK